jgi:hypothetical protein
MKKLIILGLTLGAAAGLYAQGTLTFNNFLSGTVVFHVYSPNTANPYTEFQGNIATAYSTGARNGDFPTGTQVYTGVLLGGTSGTEPAANLAAPYTPFSSLDYTMGNNFSAQILAAPGTGVAVSSLLPVSQYITTFRTTSAAAAGFVTVPSISNDPGIPGTAAAAATVVMAAWYNAGGTIASLAAAQAAKVPWGESLPINLTTLGEPASITGGAPSTAANLVGMQSFSLILPAPVAEPSTIALGLMGACAFLARFRKK